MRDFELRLLLCGSALLAALQLGGCATPATGDPAAGAGGSPAPRVTGSEDIRQALYDQLNQWKGTRYRLGGLSSKGIDCSGLTYVVFRDLFDEPLPRTTEEQGRIGRAVKRGDLNPGDLVFFKTGLNQKHVGIYVENGMFLHASRSSGVSLSSLASEYWDKRYWKARRMAATRAGI
jgi:cell wall-associated NlpC family hydrolase